MTNKFVRWLLATLLMLVATGCENRADDAAAKLKDADPQVRRAAIRALAAGEHRSPDLLRQISPLLDDKVASVRVAAALAVQRLEPEGAKSQAILTDALRGGQGPVFLEVGHLGTSSGWAVPPLLSLLADSRAPIRALAAQTLGEIGSNDDRVAAALRRGLRDNNPGVRKACETALAKTAFRSATPL